MTITLRNNRKNLEYVVIPQILSLLTKEPVKTNFIIQSCPNLTKGVIKKYLHRLALKGTIKRDKISANNQSGYAFVWSKIT